ncbi:MAG: prenylated flavin chaperone LpdD [Chloroflexota bacterium]
MSEPPSTAIWRATRGEGRCRVEALALRLGADLSVSLWGGTAPHVGAVALAQARPSLADPARASATSSVLTLLGHKDDAVARAAAERLAAALGVTVVVAAGLHVDDATPADLQDLIDNAKACVENLLGQLLRN